MPVRIAGAGITPSFNCAAPFRERLDNAAIQLHDAVIKLQLCRPLSGAVRSLIFGAWQPESGASIVPPPFGSG